MGLGTRALVGCLARIFGQETSKKTKYRRPQRRTVLCLEALEDRTVPTSIIQSASFGPNLTDWTASLGTFNRFDQSLGTLSDVVVTEAANMTMTGSGTKITSVSDNVT